MSSSKRKKVCREMWDWNTTERHLIVSLVLFLLLCRTADDEGCREHQKTAGLPVS